MWALSSCYLFRLPQGQYFTDMDTSTLLPVNWAENRWWRGGRQGLSSEMFFCTLVWARMVFQSQLKATGGQPGFPETIIKKHLVPTKNYILNFYLQWMGVHVISVPGSQWHPFLFSFHLIFLGLNLPLYLLVWRVSHVFSTARQHIIHKHTHTRV